MNYRNFFYALIIALSASSPMALAEPSCTNWITQSDGSQWRTCVGDDGKQYCEVAKDGHISRVSCK